MIRRRLKISMFTALTGREKILFLEAFFLHLWIGLLLKVIPFRMIPRLFSNPQFESPTMEETQSRHTVSGRQFEAPTREETQSRHIMSVRQSSLLELIRQAIGRAAWVSPWKNKCLISSLVARCSLRRRGIGSQLSLGVARGANDKTIAHAWLKAGDIEIVEQGGDFTELYLF